MTDDASVSRIWPVFIAAAIVAAGGFWLAIGGEATTGGDVRAVPQQPEFMAFDDLEPLESVTFARGTAPRTLRARLWQERQAADKTVTTHMDLTIRAGESVKRGDVYSFERSFDEVKIIMRADGQTFASEIGGDVGRLARTARQRVEVASTGEVLSVELVSAEAAQLQSLLGIVEQVLDLAQPRVPREAVRVDEPWSWTAPVGSTDGAVEGNTTFVARVVGTVSDAIAIETEFETVSAMDLASEAGRGTASSLWDAERGSFVRSDVRWTTTGKIGDEEVLTTSRVQIAHE